MQIQIKKRWIFIHRLFKKMESHVLQKCVEKKHQNHRKENFSNIVLIWTNTSEQKDCSVNNNAQIDLRKIPKHLNYLDQHMEIRADEFLFFYAVCSNMGLRSILSFKIDRKFCWLSNGKNFVDWSFYEVRWDQKEKVAANGCMLMLTVLFSKIVSRLWSLTISSVWNAIVTLEKRVLRAYFVRNFSDIEHQN